MMEIEPATEIDDGLLGLIDGYQRFYGVVEPDPRRNRRFFSRFLGESEDGRLLAARREGHAVGFACLYWTLSSVRAQPVALMNDLYVAESERGAGTGRALIDAAAACSAAHGMEVMTWMTALGNRRAQALYERTGAERSAWFEYELRTA